MLRSRIITGLVLAFTALIAIYLLPIPAFALFFWFVGMVAAYEYAGLAGIESRLRSVTPMAASTRCW